MKPSPPPPPTPPSRVPEPWQPRFSLATLLLVMVVCCVMSAGAYYLFKGWRDTEAMRGTFVMFTLAAPAVLLIVASLIRLILSWSQDEDDSD